jgi:hypothetical protein
MAVIETAGAAELRNHLGKNSGVIAKGSQQHTHEKAAEVQTASGKRGAGSPDARAAFLQTKTCPIRTSS